MAQVPDKDRGCWGSLRGGSGWDGVQRHVLGYCDKKPRAGCLTCWWHRSQENEARRLKEKAKQP
jgi:hypothetical protein